MQAAASTKSKSGKQPRPSASAAKPRPASAKSIRTKKMIKDAARKIFAEKGFEAAKVSDIVSGIDMAQGTFFYHYPDKKSILVEMIDDFFGEIKRMAAKWATTTDTGRDAATGFARRLAGWLYENRELGSIIRRETYNPDPEIRARIKEFYDYIYTQTERGLKLGMRLGVVRKMDPHIAAVALVGMTESVFADQLSSPKPADIDKIINEVTGIQNHGIRPKRGIFG